MSEHVVILGATSGIARPLAAAMAERHCRLLLAGRDMVELERIAADLSVRFGGSVAAEHFEALDFASHEAFFERCLERLDGRVDGVVLCYGHLGERPVAEQSFEEARRIIDVNFTSAVSILNRAAAHLESQREGYLVAMTSVAGDRGRKKNYLYGAAKAGLSVYLQGLRHRLFEANVHVLEVRPGLVDTKMTQGLVDPKSPMVAQPERVAKKIDDAIRARKNTVYAPGFWRGIMGVVRALPDPIFNRMDF